MFKLEIRLGNDAMQTGENVARALEKIAAQLNRGYLRGVVLDDNGNNVGEWSLDEEV